MKHTGRALAIGAIVFFAGLGSAQAITLASATASLSNVQITLIDLEPHDGIAPSVSFSQGALAGAAGPISYDLSPTGIVLTSTQSSADLLPLLSSGDVTASGWVNYTPTSEPDAPTFSMPTFFLSANTKMVITGTASATRTVASSGEVSALSAQLDATRFDVSQVDVTAGAHAQLLLLLASAEEFASGEYAPSDLATIDDRYLDRLADTDAVGGAAGVDSRSFTLSFSNTGAASTNGIMYFGMGVSASAVMAVAPPPVVTEPEVPAIPEPATCLPMGLGLVGIAVAPAHHQSNHVQ